MSNNEERQGIKFKWHDNFQSQSRLARLQSNFDRDNIFVRNNTFHIVGQCRFPSSSFDIFQFHPTAIEWFWTVGVAVKYHVEPFGSWSAILLVPVHAKLFDCRPEAKYARVYPALLQDFREEAAVFTRGDGHSLHSGHERSETNVPGTVKNTGKKHINPVLRKSGGHLVYQVREGLVLSTMHSSITATLASLKKCFPHEGRELVFRTRRRV